MILFSTVAVVSSQTLYCLNLTAKEKLTANDLQAYKYWLYEHSEIDTFQALVRWLGIRVQIMDETKDEKRDDRNDDKRRNRGFPSTMYQDDVKLTF